MSAQATIQDWAIADEVFEADEEINAEYNAAIQKFTSFPNDVQRPINIVTIEDPVEKNINGVNQMQVNQQAGLTFKSGLRATLRQDPDVIM